MSLKKLNFQQLLLERNSKYSLPTISGVLNLDVFILKRILREASLNKKRESSIKLQRGRRRVLTSDHIDFIKDYVDEKKFKRFTVADV